MQQVKEVVVVAPEAHRPVVTALDDVRGDTGQDETQLAGHGKQNGPRPSKVDLKNRGQSPISHSVSGATGNRALTPIFLVSRVPPAPGVCESRGSGCAGRAPAGRSIRAS